MVWILLIVWLAVVICPVAYACWEEYEIKKFLKEKEK